MDDLNCYPGIHNDKVSIQLISTSKVKIMRNMKALSDGICNILKDRSEEDIWNYVDQVQQKHALSDLQLV